MTSMPTKKWDPKKEKMFRQRMKDITQWVIDRTITYKGLDIKPVPKTHLCEQFDCIIVSRDERTGAVDRYIKSGAIWGTVEEVYANGRKVIDEMIRKGEHRWTEM